MVQMLPRHCRVLWWKWQAGQRRWWSEVECFVPQIVGVVLIAMMTIRSSTTTYGNQWHQGLRARQMAETATTQMKERSGSKVGAYQQNGQCIAQSPTNHHTLGVLRELNSMRIVWWGFRSRPESDTKFWTFLKNVKPKKKVFGRIFGISIFAKSPKFYL